jgi:cytochrome P450
VHFISTSPPMLERLLAEANEALAAGRISRPVIKNSEALQLPYLQACIKEGLRVYPPVTGLLAKEVPKGGVKIDVDGVEKYAPSGTQISWNSWGLMRNKEIFGPDADIFRPERWLASDDTEATQKHMLRMNETLSLVFGYGRFGCLGKVVANMELNKALIEVCVNVAAVESNADQGRLCYALTFSRAVWRSLSRSSVRGFTFMRIWTLLLPNVLRVDLVERE